MTVAQKKELLAEYNRMQASGGDCSQKSLALWAQNKFRLDKPPAQATISRILKQADSIIAATVSNNARSRKKAENPELESALFSWIRDQNAKGSNVNGPAIRAYAEELFTGTNSCLPEEKRLTFRFSSGWLSRFKSRYGLDHRSTVEDGTGETPDAASRAASKIKETLEQYAPQDRWNAHEFGLYFSKQPVLSDSGQTANVPTIDKSRITFLACCNSDGSEKLPLMSIGSKKAPQSFQAKTALELGLDYHHNEKAWMTRPLFIAWLHRFDAYIGQTAGRKVLLLLHACSVHDSENTPLLLNVVLHYLQPNAVQFSQPLEAGVIDCIKTMFKRRLLLRVLDNIDIGFKAAFCVDVLTAVRWAMQEWNTLSTSTISKCWHHCFNSYIVIPAEVTIGRAEIAQAMEDVCNQPVRIHIISLLHSDGEDECVEPMPLFQELENLDSPVGNGNSDLQPGYEEISVQEQLKCLATTSILLEQQGHMSSEVRKSIREAQRALRDKNAPFPALKVWQ